jgi:putative ABC transport system ATP-binding protein
MGSMTALENVEFPLVFKRIKTKARRKMARDMLIKVGLGSRLSHKPKEMSGGQQQRVGIARAFVAKPEIVFADEPTGNLDTKTAMEVMNLIKTIARDNNQTIVMVTHDRRLADFADRIIHILDGKIQSVELNHKAIKPEEVSGNNQAEKMEEVNINQESVINSETISDALDPQIDTENIKIIQAGIEPDKTAEAAEVTEKEDSIVISEEQAESEIAASDN